MGRDGEGYAGDLGQKGTEIFLKDGLDMQITFFVFRHSGVFHLRHSGMRLLAQARNP
jgi:hypothetical protein